MKQNRTPKLFSRRDFLRAALAGAGGLVVASCDQGAAVPTPGQPSAPAVPGSTGQPSAPTVPGSTSTVPGSTSGRPIYADPARPIGERVDDLVSRMSVEEKVAQMGSEAPAIERLGIQKYNWWNEALHGVARAGIATVFPQVIGLASTWNTDLIHRMAEAI